MRILEADALPTTTPSLQRTSSSSTWKGRVITWIVITLTLIAIKIMHLLHTLFATKEEDKIRTFRSIASFRELHTLELQNFVNINDDRIENGHNNLGHDIYSILISYSIEDLLRSSVGTISSLSIEQQLTIKEIGPTYNSLDLHSIRFSATDIQQIVTLFPNLETLNLSKATLDAKGYEFLQKLKKLKSLNLSGMLVLNRDLPLLARFSSLENLNLSDCVIQDGKGLKELKQLKCLTIRNATCIGGVGIQGLASLTQLESLDISSSQYFSDASLQALQTLTQLKELNLSKTSITNQGMIA
ncbi:MAG: hypothetical protein JWO53_347, partial [Chlamydiia bacterium]|nr:hypothetical protein [Chlamydiia bacterium]